MAHKKLSAVRKVGSILDIRQIQPFGLVLFTYHLVLYYIHREH